VSSKFIPGLIAVVMLSAANLVAASQPTVKSIGDQVICQCGCVQTVTACNHFECSTRAQMNAVSESEIKAGKDETTILQDFVKQYGVQVLASPPTTGFNMTVWVLPGVGLIIGLGVVVFIVRRWRMPTPELAMVHEEAIDPKIAAAVEEEMKRVTR
jgi:cytochrome c-type biogenesis protein CcmH